MAGAKNGGERPKRRRVKVVGTGGDGKTAVYRYTRQSTKTPGGSMKAERRAKRKTEKAKKKRKK
jgi:ABC-type phosphate/phosphonate transport system ATPase subunit